MIFHDARGQTERGHFSLLCRIWSFPLLSSRPASNQDCLSFKPPASLAAGHWHYMCHVLAPLSSRQKKSLSWYSIVSCHSPKEVKPEQIGKHQLSHAGQNMSKSMELPSWVQYGTVLGIPTDSHSSVLLTGLALQPLQRAPQVLLGPQALQALLALRWAAAVGAQPPHRVQLQTGQPCRALHPGWDGQCHPGGLSGCDPIILEIKRSHSKVCFVIQRNIFWLVTCCTSSANRKKPNTSAR